MLSLKAPDLLAGLRRLPLRAADIVLPPTCPGCRAALADSNALCSRCWSEIRYIEPPLCPVYGTPFAYQLGEGIVSAEALAAVPARPGGGDLRRCRPPAGPPAEIPRSAGLGGG